MSGTGAYDCQGTKFQFGGTTSPAPTAPVTQVKSIKPPQGKRPWKDRSDLDSAAREGKPGIIDWGSMTLSIFWDPVNVVQKAMKDAFMANTRSGCRLDFTAVIANTHWEFNGYVIGFGLPSIDVDGDDMVDVEIRVDGNIVVTG